MCALYMCLCDVYTCSMCMYVHTMCEYAWLCSQRLEELMMDVHLDLPHFCFISLRQGLLLILELWSLPFLF